MVSPAFSRPEPSTGAIGRYELLSELAAGGMATVYAGRARGDAGFERVVAIKKLHPHLRDDHELIEMFTDEARLAARIHHPNVIATLDAGRDDAGHCYLVMEYVAGEQLGALLRRVAVSSKRIAPPLVLRIVLDALEGLAAAHALADDHGRSLGLVHRDVSPQNVLVGKDGVARLTDFGVAKAEGRMHVTRNDVIKGKLAYMAPEQAAGSGVDQRADLFAMGVVLWEALTRRRLFASDDPAEVFRRVLYEPIPPPSSVHKALAPLDGLLGKALARDPDARFASATEFARALEQAAKGVGGIAPARAVAHLVKRLAHDKLDEEHARMRDAARRMDSAEPEPVRSQTRKVALLSEPEHEHEHEAHDAAAERGARQARSWRPRRAQALATLIAAAAVLAALLVAASGLPLDALRSGEIWNATLGAIAPGAGVRATALRENAHPGVGVGVGTHRTVESAREEAGATTDGMTAGGGTVDVGVASTTDTATATNTTAATDASTSTTAATDANARVAGMDGTRGEENGHAATREASAEPGSVPTATRGRAVRKASEAAAEARGVRGRRVRRAHARARNTLAAPPNPYRAP